MAALVWDAVGERLYETGVKNAVLYLQATGAYPEGVAWNGITSFTASPSGADSNPIYADDIKYLDLRSAEDFGATIEAYTYPDEWAQCDGSAEPTPGVIIGQQSRKPFGFACKTTIGNDTDTVDHGYKLHLVYNATASPSERAYQTINDSPEAITFSWELTTTPINVSGYKPTAYITIDSTKANPTKLAALEEVLFGRNAQEATPAVYTATTDATKQAGKTYYTRSGSGTTESPYTYTEFTGESFVAQTTYYEMTTPAHDAVTELTPSLPLPDAVIAMLS